LESESSDSSDSGGWIDVESDGEDHLSVSDGDGEDEKNREKLPENDGPTIDANRTSTLATTKVCYAHLSDKPRTSYIVSPSDPHTR
jgi:protein SDA1